MDELITLLTDVAAMAQKQRIAGGSGVQQHALAQLDKELAAATAKLAQVLMAMGNEYPRPQADMAAYLKEQYRALQPMRMLCAGDPVAESAFNTACLAFMSAICELERVQ